MKKISLLLGFSLLFSCSPIKDKGSQTAILFTNANIVDVRTGNIIKKQQIVVDSGKIKNIQSTIANPEDYTIKIDAQGKYLIPGLAEMHAHIPQPPISEELIEETLFLYLSNGITTIRGMLGHPSHLLLRENAKNGTILSPRIFTSSPSLNGNSVPTKIEAIKKITTYKKEGYDFLKIHPGIHLEVFDQVVLTANEVGIPFAGHVPVAVGIRHALASKYAAIDHVDGFIEGLVPDTMNVDPTKNGFFGFDFTPLADPAKMDELIKMAKENKVWIVPTQSLFERWFAPISSDELLLQPEMKYMPASTLENWKKRKDEYTGPSTNFDSKQWDQFTAIRRELIKKLQKDGQGMLLGSDAPQLFNVPGFSIQHEIEGMQSAGLSPLEILQSGTINPAIFFGMEGLFGEIKEDQAADMVLLNANPLEDIKAYKQISGVMVKGKWLSQEMIAEKLAKIAAKAKHQ